LIEIARLLIDAREALEAAGASYAVIGGCARNVYAEPRATKDVDFVVAGDRTSYQAVATALAARGFTGAPYAAVELPIVTPEDLIVYKLIAGRTQDWADIEKVLAALAIEGRAVDWAYIEKWCSEWDVADRAARARAFGP
jgi:hypothetical protein